MAASVHILDLALLWPKEQVFLADIDFCTFFPMHRWYEHSAKWIPQDGSSFWSA